MTTQHNTLDTTVTTRLASTASDALALRDDDVLALLDNAGLGFAKHTHHPGSHINYGNGQPTDPWVVDPTLNVRQECFIPPVQNMTITGQ